MIKFGKVITVLVLASFFASANAATTEIHQHKSLDIGDMPIPKIQLSVFRDVIDGVNVNVKVQNYLLNAPDTVVLESEVLQGHAHVFVNGIKKQRLYGDNIHIPKNWLTKGVNQIAISLNSHQHENWVKDNNNIVGSVFINLESKGLVLHNYTSQPLEGHHAHH
jgi:hypothetical protein